jgi:hypothetical protein
MWGRLYKDFTLNRLAIGRFIKEMMHDVESSFNTEHAQDMFVYSGHDSTIVPMLCALNIYNGESIVFTIL